MSIDEFKQCALYNDPNIRHYSVSKPTATSILFQLTDFQVSDSIIVNGMSTDDINYLIINLMEKHHNICGLVVYLEDISISQLLDAISLDNISDDMKLQLIDDFTSSPECTVKNKLAIEMFTMAN